MASYRTPTRVQNRLTAPLRQRPVRLAIAALPLVLLVACSPFNRHRETLTSLHAQGRYAAAFDRLSDPDVMSLYGDKNRLLWRLDRGAILLALGRVEEAIAELEIAERIMEFRREENPGESLLALLVNDNLAPYLGEPYEEMYINVLKMLAQLDAGNIRGGATVEARRMALKANLLRDEYLETLPDARADIDAPGPRDMPSDLRGAIDFTSGGEFIESPLGVFLSAVSFMHAGEHSNQQVAARRLQQVIRAQGDLIGNVDPEPFTDLADLAPGDASGLVVALSGRGPRKESTRFGPLLIDRVTVYFELPVLIWQPSEVRSARVLVRPRSGGDSSEAPPTATAAELHLIENLAKVADVNHRRTLPLLYFRTLARAAAKSYGLYEANKAVDRSTENDLARVGVRLAGLLLLATTESADIRAWNFLPGQAHVGLLDLPPGDYEARVEYLGHGGGVVYESAWRSMTIEENRLATIVTHYWR